MLAGWLLSSACGLIRHQAEDQIAVGVAFILSAPSPHQRALNKAKDIEMGIYHQLSILGDPPEVQIL